MGEKNLEERDSVIRERELSYLILFEVVLVLLDFFARHASKKF